MSDTTDINQTLDMLDLLHGDGLYWRFAAFRYWPAIRAYIARLEADLAAIREAEAEAERRGYLRGLDAAIASVEAHKTHNFTTKVKIIEAIEAKKGGGG